MSPLVFAKQSTLYYCHIHINYRTTAALSCDSSSELYFARPTAEIRPAGSMFCFRFSFVIFIFNDSCFTNYLKIYRTDLRQIIRFGRTVAVFRSLNGRCHGSQILLVLVHECRWTQAASGAAGRANVGLYPV